MLKLKGESKDENKGKMKTENKAKGTNTKKQTRHSKEKTDNKTGKKKKRVFVRVMLILLLIIIIAGSVFAYKVYQNGGGLQGILKTGLGHDENTVNNLDKLYCLFLGQSDNLTDTIMLASYDPKTQEAALLSIPRDTFIGDDEDTATAWDKINSVYQTGPENTLKEVRELTGINVQYYLKVDTAALRALVDEVGGVYFDVPIDMKYDAYSQDLHIDVKAGYQLLDGATAEEVVRFRHNNDGSTYPQEYGGEDLGRMKTQRAFLTALLEQTAQKMDVNMVFDFLDIAEQYVETNLDFDAVKDYVPYLLEFNTDNLKTATLPGEPDYANGVAVYNPDEEEVEKTVNELFYGVTPEEELDGNIIDGNSIANEEIGSEATNAVRIELLNGSGDISNLTEATSELEALGFEVVQSGNTSTTGNTTIIERNNISETNMSRLEEIFGTTNTSSGETSETVDVTIIIGTDYVM